jgi:hypothetical protein
VWLLAILVAGLSVCSSSLAGQFQPTSGARFCNALASDFPSTIAYNDTFLTGSPSCTDPGSVAVNTAYDVTLEFSLPSGNYNPGMAPMAIIPGDTAVTNDGGITNGSKVGGIRFDSTVGLMNGACNSGLTTEFILYESTTSSTNTVYPDPPGEPDRFADMVSDTNSDGFAESSSLFVSKTPAFYLDYFDPDYGGAYGPWGSAWIAPIARYTGATKPAGGEWTVASVFAYTASSLAPFNNAVNQPHPFARVGRSATEGIVLVLVVNDPTAVGFGPSSITDACAPFSAKVMLKGTASSGQVRSRTPTTAGTRAYSSWSYSERDADGDNIGNSLDTCPYNTNTGSDSDGDGIDNACDGASTPGNTDVDADGYLNRGDICPQVQWFTSIERGELLPSYASAAPKGGPRTDNIGDQCDSSPATSDGAYIEWYTLVAKCIGGTDADGDGYCAPQDGVDTNASVKGWTLNVGPDQDGVPAGDGYGSNTEMYLTTDPVKHCPATTAANDEPIDAWPPDFDDNRVVNVFDITAIQAVYGQTVPPASPRFDLVPNKVINVFDLSMVTPPVYGSICTP